MFCPKLNRALQGLREEGGGPSKRALNSRVRIECGIRQAIKGNGQLEMGDTHCQEAAQEVVIIPGIKTRGKVREK